MAGKSKMKELVMQGSIQVTQGSNLDHPLVIRNNNRAWWGGLIGGVVELCAGDYQYYQNGKDEVVKTIGYVAGGIIVGGVVGLGAGGYQYYQYGKDELVKAIGFVAGGIIAGGVAGHFSNNLTHNNGLNCFRTCNIKYYQITEYE